MIQTRFFIIKLFFVLSLVSSSVSSYALSLPDLIEQHVQSVVAIGKVTPLERNGNQILGTGFAVGDGSYVITNYHVVDDLLSTEVVQYYAVIAGVGKDVNTYKAVVEEIDPLHDLALLSFKGKLPAVSLAEDELLKPGHDIAFTGFPIAAAIGLYPATHRGIISAITPDAIPAINSNKLSAYTIQRLKQPDLVYQLDAIAYPGNSGSAVFDMSNGEVIGVINKVFVSQGKESALTNPTGISYAIPVRYVKALINKKIK